VAVNAELESKLRTLIDKDEIHGVLMQYCRGVDRAVGELIEASFHEDGIDDHGYFKVAGAKAIADTIIGRIRTGSVASMHLIGNETIELEGDLAIVESYFLALLHEERDGGEFTRIRCARYLDRMERRAGRWGIAYRVVVDEWDRVDPVEGHVVGRELFHRGQRSTEDIVFRLRELTPEQISGTVVGASA
jgi:hypothetical protein